MIGIAVKTGIGLKFNHPEKIESVPGRKVQKVRGRIDQERRGILKLFRHGGDGTAIALPVALVGPVLLILLRGTGMAMLLRMNERGILSTAGRRDGQAMQAQD